jgi:hypothetical protein
MDYEYFHFDNAFYRKRAHSGLFAVDDVWFPNLGWTPYKGDRQEKYMFGDRIEFTRLPRRAVLESSQTTRESSLINLTGESKDRAFQILTAPVAQKRDGK